jgi:ribosome biogenesis GTPase
MFDLGELGFSASFSEAFQQRSLAGLVPGRIASGHTHVYRVLAAEGEFLAEVSGRLRHEAKSPRDFPAVGDFVAAALRPDEGRATIHAVLPRRTCLVRKEAGDTVREQVLAANLDTLLLVGGLDGDYNPRRVERALVLAWDSGAQPVIVLTKADLASDAEVAARRREIEGLAPGVPVYPLSALSGAGVAALEPYLVRGRTLALLGSSGTGKSTLVNRLLGEARQETAAVRAHDDRGRHTTTFRELIRLPGGASVIDTPGLREIQLWADGESLDAAFDDVAALGARCRFGDCAHEGEPGCAVAEALASGALAAARFESYTKLQKELRYLERRVDVRAQLEEKARWKAIHRAHRRRPRG